MSLCKKLTPVVVALMVWLAAGAALAQDGGGSYLGEPRTGYSIYFFGDSLAGGLWAGSTRMAVGNPRLTTKGRFKEGSGLARPRFYDWSKAIAPVVERNNVDVAVIMIGINDGRPVKLSDRRLPVGSKEWTEYYKRRIDSLLLVLKGLKVPTYWMELPPMANPVRDEVSRLIGQIQRERAQAAGVRYIEIRKLFLKEDGSYTDRGIDVEGRVSRLRSRDGVHFIRAGNNKVARIVLDAIERDIAVADGIRKPDPETPVTNAPSAEDALKPIFGKALNLGEVAVINPGELPAIDAVTIARPMTSGATGLGTQQAGSPATPEETVEQLRKDAAPGSAAERLFATGAWVAKPGRFDDFSYKAE